MQKNKQKLLSLLLTVVMVIGLLPMTAFAADDRSPISTVEATSMITPPVYGATIKKLSFTVTQGSPAYFLSAGSSASWVKKSGDSWESVYSGTFTEGTWRYRTQVCIDGPEGTTHVLAWPLNVSVNGELWAENTTPAVGDDYSYAWVSSPEYTVTAPSGTPLTFTDNSGFNIPNNQSGKAITAYSVASFVSGGTKPYTFSKTSGPNWIAVSSAGQISGTPTTIGTNADLVVRVTDNEGAYEEITISVGNTIPQPGDRSPISTVEATSTITPPVYGATIKKPSFTVTQGSPAYFLSGGSSASWVKKSGDSWENVTSGTFTEGTWRYRTQVCIDGPEGTTHVLAAPLNVSVNGASWLNNGTPSVRDTYSYAWVSSPEYTVTATPLVFADSTAYDIPAGTVGESYTASTALTASGGKLPYVFTVAPAVDGLSIGSDNKLVYTRPTVADAKTATIKVTDNLGDSKTITINIGAVTAAPETTYALTVTNGTDNTGGSPYAAGTEVSITANDPASGKQFKEWTTSNGGTFASATSASTTFTMPDKDVTVTATYKDAPVTTYAVTVNSGNGSGSTGSGSYTAGTTVNIYAGNRSGYTFTGWTSSDVTITNASNKNASFTMPAKNVTVKANWSYNSGGGGGGGSSSNTNATLSDTKAEFDKNEGDDLKVTLKSGSYSLRSIRNGSYTLEEGRDYTISGGTVTIKASYLDSLKEGKHYLTFDMNGGTDPVLTIIVTETTKTDPQEEKPAIEETVKFEDIKSGDWFYDAVNYIYNAGLMVGTSDTTFSPYTNTTRGMIVTILHTLEGSPMPNTTNGFTDVGADKYYTDAVAWASANKIVSGYGNGIFSPDNSITREQMAVILMNYAQYKGYDVSTRADLSKFADGEYISPWAKDAMSWANAEGLMQGSGNQLMPADNAQRCQVAAILQSFLERIAK